MSDNFKRTFSILEFSQKKRTNEFIHFYDYDKFLRSFFGRIRGHQKSFWNYFLRLDYSESTKQMEQTLRAKVKIFFKSENLKKCF